jgi:hypothetical protein
MYTFNFCLPVILTDIAQNLQVINKLMVCANQFWCLVTLLILIGTNDWKNLNKSVSFDTFNEPAMMVQTERPARTSRDAATSALVMQLTLPQFYCLIDARLHNFNFKNLLPLISCY